MFVWLFSTDSKTTCPILNETSEIFLRGTRKVKLIKASNHQNKFILCVHMICIYW